MSTNRKTGISSFFTRRWLVAIGGVVSVLLFSRKCGKDEAPIAAVVTAHDAMDRTLETKIQEQKLVAATARKAEAAAVAQKAKKVLALRARTARRTSRPAEESPVRGDTLVDQILVASDSALSAANVQITALTTALDLSEARATASDSVLHVVATEGEEQCRMLGVLPCPSRLAVAVLTGIAAAALLLR